MIHFLAAALIFLLAMSAMAVGVTLGSGDEEPISGRQ